MPYSLLKLLNKDSKGDNSKNVFNFEKDMLLAFEKQKKLLLTIVFNFL
jgi:hypothetical protein